MIRQLVDEAALAGEPVSLGKDHPVLVAVELPDDFRVADGFEIKERDLVPRPERGSSAADRIEMPVDVGAKAEVLVPEKVEAAIADLLGPVDDPVALLRQAIADDLDQTRHLGRIEEEATGRAFRAATN